jgi:hypothetical protein
VYNGRVHNDDNNNNHNNNNNHDNNNHDNNNYDHFDQPVQHSMGNVERLFIDVCWWHTNTRVLNGIKR